MIYYLLFIIIVLFLIVLLIDKDIFSPSAIICESYILSICCAIINKDVWNLTMSKKTMYLLLLGISMFIIVSELIVHIKLKNTIKTKNSEKTFNKIEINKTYYRIFVIIQIITIFVYFSYVLKVVGGISSFSNFSNLMNYYRENTSYGELDTGIPTIVNQFVKISKILAYFSSYIFIVNRSIDKKNGKKDKENNFLYCVSIVSYGILSLLSGGRFDLIAFCISSIVTWKIVSDIISENKGLNNIKNVMKILVVTLIIMIAFSNLRNIVGRTNKEGLVEYISKYFGGSIQLLDLYMENPTMNKDVLGKETFYGINRTLSKFGLVKNYKMHLEFRAKNGIVIGNVYTSFRNFYSDFGIYGVIILQIILSIFWSLYYKKIKRKNDLKKFDINLVIYCMYINTLFLHSFRDSFFSTVITISTITTIIYLLIVKKIIIKEVKTNDT